MFDCNKLTGAAKDVCRGHDDDGVPVKVSERHRRKFLSVLEEGREPMLPPLLEQGKNYAISTMKHVKAGGKKASPELAALRLVVCRTNVCEKFRASDEKCAGCGCPVTKKVNRLDEPCPLKFWPGEERGPSLPIKTPPPPSV